jgi:hypothetical protein
MKRPPTDREILEGIYHRHYHEFIAFDKAKPSRGTKNYVPIDIEMLSKELSVDPDIVFGRLYYDLDKRYGYKNDDGAETHFFILSISGDKHCVHFPYLASVLAELQERHRQFRLATTIAIVSLAVSVVALFVSMFA